MYKMARHDPHQPLVHGFSSHLVALARNSATETPTKSRSYGRLMQPSPAKKQRDRRICKLISPCVSHLSCFINPIKTIDMFLSHGGTPKSSSYLFGIFHYKSSSYWGTSIYGNPHEVTYHVTPPCGCHFMVRKSKIPG